MLRRAIWGTAFISLGVSPLHAEPNYMMQASQLSCQQLTRTTVDSRSWRRGGTPDATPDAPFGIPVYAWTQDVWREFQTRAVDCNRGKQVIEASIITSLVSQSYRENGPIAERAAQEREGLQAKKAFILNGAKQAIDGGGTADELSAKLDGLRRLASAQPDPTSAKRGGLRGSASAPPALSQTDIDEVNTFLLALEDKIRSVRLAEAEDWEKGKGARDAKAEAAKAEAARRSAEDARIQSFMRDKAEAAAAQRAEAEAVLRREERAKAEAKQVEDERLEVERATRLAAEKAEQNKLEAERLAKACPSFVSKNAYYDGRMKKSIELGEKIKNAPAISLNGPGPACPFLNDQISIYKEMHDDLYACLGSGDPKIRESVENMTGMVIMFQQQKQGVGCQ